MSVKIVKHIDLINSPIVVNNYEPETKLNVQLPLFPP